MSTSRYLNFLASGAVVGLICVGLRQLLGMLMPHDSGIYYILSVAIANCIGFAISYAFQHLFVFTPAHRSSRGRYSWLTFLAINIVIACCNALLAWGIRSLGLDAWLGPFSPAAAMLMAALILSIVNYLATATLVFGHR